eukprot:3706721-Pyramimonas_sp.AAC.1
MRECGDENGDLTPNAFADALRNVMPNITEDEVRPRTHPPRVDSPPPRVDSPPPRVDSPPPR